MPRLKLLFIILFWILSISDGFSQNLVYNGSFEDYSSCPDNFGQLSKAKYWFSANWGGSGSSEYFNACSNPSTVGVPDNGFTYQYARTGNGYVGTGCFVYYEDYREYIEGTLKHPLVQGESYCVSFYVNLSNPFSYYGIDALGLYFTNDSLITDSSGVYDVKPQIANDSLNIITDTLNWVKISGTFIAAGGERFFTFGNFKTNSQTNYINLNGIADGVAYYLLDDVAVYECDAPVNTAKAGRDITICKGESVKLGMQRYDEYLYKWYTFGGELIDTSSYLTVSPTTTTSYVLKLEDFKYDITSDTVTVTVDESCNKNIVYIPNIFSPNGDGANDVFRVRGPEIDSLHLQVYNRWGNMVFETKDINGAWDGTYSGKKCEAGVYAYWAEITFTNGEKEIKKGDVSLVR